MGRQTAQAAAVAEEMAELATAMTEIANDYDQDGLDEPATLIRNQARSLKSYVDLLCTGTHW